MKYKILCSCVLLAFAVAITPAQTKNSFSAKCDRPDVWQTIPAGDQPGHVFALAQGKCASTREIGGAKAKEGAFSDHEEISGNDVKVWGVYIETYDSGDKIFYTYQSTGTLQGGAFQTGQTKYQVSGGTGKMTGIKGSGSCKLTGNADGSIDFSCTGEYTLAGAAPAKM